MKFDYDINDTSNSFYVCTMHANTYNDEQTLYFKTLIDAIEYVTHRVHDTMFVDMRDMFKNDNTLTTSYKIVFEHEHDIDNDHNEIDDIACVRCVMIDDNDERIAFATIDKNFD